MPSAEPTIRRILVALDPSTHGRAAVELAARIAARVHAELVGLYVEDETLLRLAAFPFAREFSVTRTTGRSLSAPAMTRAMRTEARRAREALARAAERYGVRWAFDVRRGEVARELLTAGAAADLLVLGRTRAAVTRRVRVGSTVRGVVGQCTKTVLVVPGGSRTDGTVVALYEDAASGAAVVATAAALARPDGRELLVLVTDEALRADAEAALAASGLPGRVGLAPVAELSAALAAVAGPGAATLVVHRTAGREAVLDAVACPVAIVA